MALGPEQTKAIGTYDGAALGLRALGRVDAPGSASGARRDP